jgi:hypothetical protein
MNWQIRLSSAKNDKIYGLVDIIVSIFVDMESLCCLLQVISFESFVVHACFIEGLNGEFNEFCLLLFNGFWK